MIYQAIYTRQSKYKSKSEEHISDMKNIRDYLGNNSVTLFDDVEEEGYAI